MATTFNITSTYAGEKAAGYIQSALLGGNTLAEGGITVKPNVKYREVMQLMSISNDLVSDASCDFTATSELIITERFLEPKHLQVNLEFCKETFEQDWQAIEMGFSAHQDTPKEFSDFLIGHVSTKVAGDIETKIWQGSAGAGSFDGISTILSADTDSIKVTQVAVDSSNVLAKLGEVVDSIPEAVYGKEDLTLYVSSNVMRAYVRALGGFGSNGLGSAGVNNQGALWYSGQGLDFEGIRLFMAKGLANNTIIASQKENLAFGTGLLADQNEVKLIDLADIDGSKNVRAIMRFTAGVQVAVPADVVYYGA